MGQKDLGTSPKGIPRQLELPLDGAMVAGHSQTHWDPASLGKELERLTGLVITVAVTDNTSSMLSLKRDRRRNGATVRLHRMFLQADHAILAALADWLKRTRTRESGAVINRFIRNQRHLIRPREPRPVAVRARGECYDLEELFEEVNREHFSGRITARITWGRQVSRRRRRRSIRFGSYSTRDNIIRINPVLDQAFVPRYFVRYLVFHEMLHAHLDIEESPGKRRSLHPPEFRRLERAYPDYDRAMAWQKAKENLNKLLRGPRKLHTGRRGAARGRP